MTSIIPLRYDDPVERLEINPRYKLTILSSLMLRVMSNQNRISEEVKKAQRQAEIAKQKEREAKEAAEKARKAAEKARQLGKKQRLFLTRTPCRKLHHSTTVKKDQPRTAAGWSGQFRQ
jgi:hypothetical protein